MQLFRKKGLFESGRVIYVPVDQLRPNPAQPRRQFTQEGLEELAASIREHGILQPCMVVDVDQESSSLLALVENLQRRDLDFWEEALALDQLIHTYSLSQEEAARRIGKSQSAVANKLRLLKLSPAALQRLRDAGLSERHARALLRLDGEEAQLSALDHIIAQGLNVAQTDAYIDALLSPRARPKKPTYLIKDVRLFLNTVTKGLALMQGAGIQAQCGRQETEDAILLTIRIPKQAR